MNMLSAGQMSAIHRKAREQHARDVLSLAASAKMPDTFWHSDQRIARACKTLGIDATEARKVGVEEARKLRPDRF